MGAFENQINENETFDSLTQLYGDSLDENRRLRAEIAELRKDVVWAAGSEVERRDRLYPLRGKAYYWQEYEYDGTDAGLLAAVRKAREGE